MNTHELLCFSDGKTPAQRLASALGWRLRIIETHRFPDDEIRVRVPADPAPHVVIYRTLDHPNDKLLELLFAARTLRDKGAREIGLIAPYLCYMRQDAENTPGEAVSQRIVGGWLADAFDAVYTVDAHLHRTPRLSDAIPARKAINISAAAALGEFVRTQGGNPVLLGPDEESDQWVRQMAQAAQLEYAVATKVRAGDEDVRISLPNVQWKNRNIVLVDDVVSSGATMITIAGLLRQQGVAKIDVAVTHPLFAHHAVQKLRAAGIGEIWSSDSIEHESNSVHLATLWAAELTR